MASLDKVKKWFMLNKKLEKYIAQKFVDSLRIVTPNVDQKVCFLSGGNQQKTIVARWLNTNADIIIMDEPTRGIDVGTKREIYEVINSLVAQGKAIIVISSEMEEIMGICDRIIVIHDFAVSQVFGRNLCHLLVGQFKIPDIDILLHPLHMDRLGNDGHAALSIPAKNHLSRALSILSANLSQLRVGEDTVLSLSQRSPGLRNHAVSFHILEGLLLNKERMQFYLVDCRNDLHILTQIGKRTRIEICHADGFGKPISIGFFQTAVGCKIISHGLMKQNQVRIVHVQLRQ